ncbi:two component system histidine kinase [Bifidobacterium actinocoloniiforme DSM 22766]|uniref:histidine kinase n=1 Tax=Bifidobacterium actinocoloniiforme DSM 22766 TaxID=1437605 RepID=A0A086YZZ9_9BIFI|nr:histidine kinase [Bifidobacterium actinocoloniiforme]KFI39849.1 two component system histidine kinase [Bifidobacterium actinocoloniiforme DSM 22766]
MNTAKAWCSSLVSWWRSHLLARDGLLALAVIFLSLLFAASPIMGDGFLAPTSRPVAILFGLLLVLPLVIRRSRPDLAANIFVCIVLAQLAVGPTLIPADATGLIMLYSALVYGDRRRSRRYVILAAALVTLESVLYATVNNLGPLSRLGSRPASPAEGQARTPVCQTKPGESIWACGPQIALNLGLGLLSLALLLLLVVFLAFWDRSRKQALTAMRERNAAIEYRQREQARLAASAERARIARDMHDLVAHTLSIVIVQSDAGRYAGTRDPALALRVMGTIRQEAGRALHDMNRLFGSFTDDGQEDTPSAPDSDARTGTGAHTRTAATTGGGRRGHTAGQSHDRRPASGDGSEINAAEYYDGIDDLVRQARQASPGLTLERTVEGKPEPDKLGAKASLAAYRCVQEALSNIRKHAGPRARAQISEHWSSDGLRLVARDDGRGAADALETGDHQGYGLIGMSERVEALGGRMLAGPRPAGGFSVDVTIPLGSGGSMATSAHDGTDRRTDEPVEVTGLVADKGDLERGPGESRNRIERLSAWTAEHYLLVDGLLILPLLLLLTASNATYFTLDANLDSPGRYIPLPAAIIETVCISLPLVVRRRLPNASAALVASVATLELLAVPWIATANTLVLVSIYSVAAYGRGKTRLWVPATLVADLVLLFVRLRCEVRYSSPSILAWVLGDRSGPRAAVNGSPSEVAAALLATTAITCACALVLGLWRRASGSSLILQRERQEALLQGEAQRRRLAANAERARIGAQIQAEVATTLSQVIGRANAGIAMIRKADGQGSGVSPEAIDQAFEEIGRAGRAALARMRQLLDILRQTSSSDASQESKENEPALRLHPVESS